MKLNAYAIAELDCRNHQLTTDPKHYAQVNREAYSLVIETWTCLGSCLDPQLGDQLQKTIAREGLLTTIDELYGYAKQYIASSRDGAPQRCLEGWIAWFPYDSWDRAEFLEFLRYPKRFSPVDAELVTAAGVDAYFSFNKKLKISQRTELPRYFIDHVRVVTHTVIERVRLRTFVSFSRVGRMVKLKTYLATPDKYTLCGALNSGATCDAGRNIPDKIKQLALDKGSFLGPLYSFVQQPRERRSIYYPKQRKWEPVPTPYSKVVAVPKDYSKPRIIAESQTWRLYEQDAIVEGLRQAMSTTIISDIFPDVDDEFASVTLGELFSVHDQSWNRTLARYGAQMGLYATLDLSSASDSITRSLLVDLGLADLGYWLPQELLLVAPERRQIPDARVSKVGDEFHHRVTAQIALPSGERLTFPVEALIFLAIVLVAWYLTTIFTGEKILLPSVYGDDLAVDHRTYDLCCEILTALGFVVNTDKSYAIGEFRESCGGDYISSQDVTTLYWPRKALDFSAGVPLALQSLVELERAFALRLGKRGWTVCEAIANTCRKYYPQMTSTNLSYNGTVVGEDVGDLLEPNCKVPTCDPPYRKRTPDGTATTIPPELVGSRRYASVLVESVGRPRHVGCTWTSPIYLDSEMFRYAEFLMHGPRYDSELDRLLGVTAVPTRTDRLDRTPQEQWVVKRY